MRSMAMPRRRSWLWLQGLACGAVMALMPAVAILGLVLLAPGLLVYALEEAPGKPMGRTMLLLGAAASFGQIRVLWDAGNTLDTALTILSDPIHPGTAWIAAGAGWMVSELIQMGGGEVLEVLARHRATALRQERARLEEEWGTLSAPGSAEMAAAEPGPGA